MKRLALSVMAFALVIALLELVARWIPGDLTPDVTFFYPSGHSVYFGTRQVSAPFIPMDPYYWLMPPNTEL